MGIAQWWNWGKKDGWEADPSETHSFMEQEDINIKEKKSDGRERGWNSWVGAQQPPSNELQQLPKLPCLTLWQRISPRIMLYWLLVSHRFSYSSFPWTQGQAAQLREDTVSSSSEVRSPLAAPLPSGVGPAVEQAHDSILQPSQLLIPPPSAHQHPSRLAKSHYPASKD